MIKMTHKGPLIYMLTFPNSKKYVGQTMQSFETRMNQHKNASKRIKGGCRLLSAAIRKYGWENIKKEVILDCDENMLDEYESRFINVYNTLSPDGYNLITGGHSNKHMSSDTRNVMSEAAKKRDTSVYRKFEDTENLPKYIGKVNTKYMTGYKISKHPSCSSKYFCSSLKYDEEKLQDALKFLERLDNGEIKVTHLGRSLPEGIQQSGNGFRVYWKDSNGKRSIKNFNTGPESRDVKFQNACNHMKYIRMKDIKSDLNIIINNIKSILESYERQEALNKEIDVQIEKLRTMFND